MKTILITILTTIIYLNANALTIYTVIKNTDPDPYKYPYDFNDAKCDPVMYGTLQWAIRKSLDTNDDCMIVFNIPGQGPFTILLNYTLPAIGKKTVIIDATTQPGYSLGNPQIILDGFDTKIETGFNFYDNKDCEVKGIHFMHFGSQAMMFQYSNQFKITGNYFTSNGRTGQKIEPANIRIINSSYGEIKGNYVGIEPDGDETGNYAYGIVLTDYSNNNIIGGINPGEANKIVKNIKFGIWVTRESNFNRISGNIIYEQDIAISLYPDGNKQKKLPYINEYKNGLLKGESEKLDIIELFASKGNESANEYMGTTQTDYFGRWEIAYVNTNYDFVVATATDYQNNTSALSLSFNVPEQGSLCEAPIELYDERIIDFTLPATGKLWLRFFPDTGSYFIYLPQKPVCVQSLELFSGTCSDLKFIDGSDSLMLVYQGFKTEGEQYFIRITGMPQCQGQLITNRMNIRIYDNNCPPDETCEQISNEYFNVLYNLPWDATNPNGNGGSYANSSFLYNGVCAWKCAWGSPQVRSWQAGQTPYAYLWTGIFGYRRGEGIKQRVDLLPDRIYHVDYTASGHVGLQALVNSQMNIVLSHLNIQDCSSSDGAGYLTYHNGFISLSNNNQAVILSQYFSNNLAQTVVDLDLSVPSAINSQNYIYLYPHSTNSLQFQLYINHFQVHLPQPIFSASYDPCENHLILQNTTPHLNTNHPVSEWEVYEDNNPIPIASNNNQNWIFYPDHAMNVTVVLTIIYNDDNGQEYCRYSTSQNHTLVSSINPVLTATPSEICAGEEVTITCTTDGEHTYDYYWENGIGGPSIVVNPQTTTTYTVWVYDFAEEEACFASASITVTVHDQPDAEFTYTGFCQGEPFNFTSSSSFSGYTYEWDINNDGVVDGYGPNLSYSFMQTSPGYHPVSLNVIGQCGANSSQYIYVAPQDNVANINVDCCVDDPIRFDWIHPVDNTYFFYNNDAYLSNPGVTNWNSSQTYLIRNTLYISAGQTLNISNQTIVSFGPQGKIDIAPGGTLNVSGNSVLTGTCIDSPTMQGVAPPVCMCRNMWEGIRVRGTNYLSHNPFNQQLTGRLIINGAIIQDAHIAVLVGTTSFPFSGGTPSNPYDALARNGYIEILNCSFINNGIGVKFLDFIPPAGANYFKRLNNSIIKNCVFRILASGVKDNGYLTGNYYTYPNQYNPYFGKHNTSGRTVKGIELWGQIIKPENYLSGNTFYNIECGISSNNSSYNVSNSSFYNMARCIHIFNDNPSSYSTKHQIIDNTFLNSSDNALEITSGYYDYIRGNMFGDPFYNFPQSSNPRSILFNSTSDFIINDNTFNIIEQAIFLNGMSTGSNFIGYEHDGNIFFRTRLNIIGLGNNNSLQTKCNNSDNNWQPDYLVNWYLIGQVADQGMAVIPGATFDVNTKRPAGNRFWFPYLLRNEIASDINCAFNYYQHNYPEERKATNNNSPWIQIHEEPISFDTQNPDNSCLLWGNGGDPSFLLPEYSNELSVIQMYQNQYNLLAAQTDQGQTNYLLSVINTMQPGQLKNMLLSHFPLSDTVIVATVERENPLAPGLLKEVLINNSPVSKNVWRQIAVKINELPSGISSQIKNAQGDNQAVTTLTTLQRRIDEHTSRAKHLSREIVKSYLDSNDVESALNFLKTIPFREAEYTVIATLADDSLTLAEASLRLQNFQPENESEQDWKAIQEMLISLKQNGKTVFELDSTQLAQVWQIAMKENHTPAVGNARAILYKLYGTEFPVNFVPEINALRNAKNNPVKSVREAVEIDIYPSPASDRIVVSSKYPFGVNETLTMTDISGRIVLQKKIPENTNEFTLNISLPNGVYLCKIYNGENQLFEKNIIIQK